MIHDVYVEPVKRIPDSRGRIVHFVRKTDLAFQNFDLQEVYFSWIYPGAIKAWHRHKLMTLNYSVLVGDIKLVLYDSRTESSTFGELEEIYLGEHSQHIVVRIPPMVWNGFMAVGGEKALVANATDYVHDPKEIERCSLNDFNHLYREYDWNESLIG